MSVYYPQSCVIMRLVFEDFAPNTNIGPLFSGIGPLKLDELQKVYKLPILAKRSTVSVNDYTQADTFEMEIDYKQFPFDPRCIRSAGVSIHMENMGKLFTGNGGDVRIEPSADNTVFQGFADEETISFDDESRVVRMEGRDFTGLFIDQAWTGEEIDTDEPLDDLIEGFFEDIKALDQIKVDNRTGAPLPTLAQFAPDFELGSIKRNPKPNESLWDVIQDLVTRAALIAYIEIDKLVITKPQVLYDETKAKRFIYGKNLKHLEVRRRLGRKRGFNIACRSLDFKTKQTIIAKIPLEGTVPWGQRVGIGNGEIKLKRINPDGSEGEDKIAPYISFRFSNMTKAQLIEKGQNIFEELSRQQLEGELVTHEMEVPQVDGDCFSTIDMHIGAPIKILIDQGDMEGISNLKTAAERKRFLINRCYEPAVASALADTIGKFSLTFYTKSLKLTIDQESGFKMDLNFINFIQLDNKGL